MKEYRCAKCNEVIFTYSGSTIDTPIKMELILLKGLYKKLFSIKALGEVIVKSFKEGFTGNIQLNFFKGGITNINRNESIKMCQEKIEQI